MRFIIMFTTLLLAGSCSSLKKTSSSTKSLYGTWVPQKQEMGGRALPATIFSGQKLILKDSSYTVIAESIDKGIVRYTNDNRMDIFGKEGVNREKHFTAIYKYEKNELTVCYNLKGDKYPEDFDTKGKPLYFLSVFIRETAK